MNNSICQKRSRPSDLVFKILINLAALITILLLVGIMGYVFVKGIPQVNWTFLSTGITQ